MEEYIMEKEKEKDDFNRPIGMSDTVTPFTKKPIDQIDANAWHTMSAGDLCDQRSFLYSRMQIVISSSGHPDTIAQMQRGLNTLDAIIDDKNRNTLDNSTMGLI